MPTPSNFSHPAAPLLQALQERVLPKVEWNASTHIVIAREYRKQLSLPPGVKAVPLLRQGRRVAVRSSRDYPRAVLFRADWPLDGIQEFGIPRLVMVVRGKAGFRAGNYVLQCPLGTVICVPPGVPHTRHSISHLETLPPDAQNCSLLWMTPMVSGLSCRMCHNDGEQHRESGEGEKLFLHRPQILQLFYMLFDEVVRDSHHPSGPFDTSVVESLLLPLIRMVLRDIHNEHYLLQEVPPHGEDHSVMADPLEQAVEYINTHYASPLALDDVARHFFMSRAQFTRKFRELTGQSFLEFLNARRLEQAKRLLAETDWTAVMIARYVGFGSTAYFHRIFMREMALSPMQFRGQSRTEKQK